MVFLESKEIKLKWVLNSSPLTHQAHISDALKCRVEENIYYGFRKKGFTTEEARRCIFHLEFSAPTIEEATKLFNVWFLTIRNKYLKV